MKGNKSKKKKKSKQDSTSQFNFQKQEIEEDFSRKPDIALLVTDK